MENQKLVLVETLCIHYELEASFFESLEEIGLIILVRENEEIYIPEEKVTDVILNLLGKVESLQTELNLAKQRLGNLTKEI
jgi:hypothetical protein